MNVQELLSMLREKVTDPEVRLAVIRILTELALGIKEIDADSRLLLQAELDELLGVSE